MHWVCESKKDAVNLSVFNINKFYWDMYKTFQILNPEQIFT